MNASSQLLCAELLTRHPLLTNAEVERRLAKIAAHAEAHAKRPLDPVGRQHPRVVPIPPRRKKPEFSSRR